MCEKKRFMNDIIKNNLSTILSLCRKYKVSKLYAFGSAVRGNFTVESDIDLLYRFENINVADYADNLYNFKCELEQTFQRKVDMVNEKYLTNPYFIKSLNNSKILLYERRRTKISA